MTSSSLLGSWLLILTGFGTVGGFLSGFWYSRKHAKIENRHARLEDRDSLIKEAEYWRDQVAYWRKESRICHETLTRAIDISAQITDFLETHGPQP